MKNLLFFILFAATIGNTFAKKNANNNSPVLGTWKFTKKSAINEFQQVQLMNKNETVKEEFFVFSAKNKFQHQFINDNRKRFS